MTPFPRVDFSQHTSQAVHSSEHTAAQVRLEPAGEQEDFLLLADGLKRLIGQWPRRVTERSFPAAVKAYQGLRVQFFLGSRPQLPGPLLSDLCHEISQHVDTPVRQAAVRCLRRHATASRAAN